MTNKWISIKDKLPKGKALFICKGHEYLIGEYEKEKDRVRFEDWQLTNVTHWMPLPKPPKQ